MKMPLSRKAACHGDRRGAMRVLSVNVGLPREVEWQGKMVTTAIFKELVAGRAPVESVRAGGHRRRVRRGARLYAGGALPPMIGLTARHTLPERRRGRGDAAPDSMGAGRNTGRGGW